jgi:type IV secretory pathway VirB3-like protein
MHVFSALHRDQLVVCIQFSACGVTTAMSKLAYWSQQDMYSLFKCLLSHLVQQIITTSKLTVDRSRCVDFVLLTHT